MILLLGQDCYDETIENVDDWITALGGQCARLNGENMNEDDPFTVRFTEGALRVDVHATGMPDGNFASDDVTAVWSRRWHTYRNLEFVNEAADTALVAELRTYLMSELRVATAAIQRSLPTVPWLTKPGQSDINKLVALREAAHCGLTVPATLVTNDRETLAEFLRVHGRVITKSLWNPTSFVVDGEQFCLYTTEVRPADVEAAPARFFPSLFQSMVEKTLEARVFYLAGRCWPMALFSQLDTQTSLDFRIYNHRRPNRYVPYRLPQETETAIHAFMKAVALETGSLDLIRTPSGEHVFLEVNPIGQFGMVSAPCNYRLEKLVAEHLIGVTS